MPTVSYVRSTEEITVEESTRFIDEVTTAMANHDPRFDALTFSALGMLSVLHASLHSKMIRQFAVPADVLEDLRRFGFLEVERVSKDKVNVILCRV